MDNKFSMPNLSKILEAQIKALEDVNDVLVKSKIDANTLKKISESIKPISDTIKSLVDAANALGGLKINSVLGSIKFKLAVKGLVDNIVYIADKMKDLELQKNTATNVKAITACIREIVEISGDLTKIGMMSILLVALKPLIMKTIDLVLDINKRLNKTKKAVDVKFVIALGDSLKALGTSLLVFVLTTGGGLVPLAAMISLVAVGGFVWLYTKLFGNKKAMKQIMESSLSIKQLAISLLLLTSTVVLLALTGLLITEELDNIGMVVKYLVIVTGIFILVGLVTKLMKEVNATKSILYIAGTIMMLSFSVIALVLAGKLIDESWHELGMVSVYLVVVTGIFAAVAAVVALMKTTSATKSILYISGAVILLSIGAVILILAGKMIEEDWEALGFVAVYVGMLTVLFIAIGLASKFVEKGGPTLLLMAISVAILTAVALLMIYVGQKLEENWVQVLIVTGFIVVMGILFAAAGWASKFILIGAGAIAAMSGTLILFSISMAVLTKNIQNVDIESIKSITDLIWTFGKTFAGFVVLSPFVVIGAAAIGLMSGSLLIFSHAFLNMTDSMIKLKTLGLDVTKDEDLDILTNPIKIMEKALEYASDIDLKTITFGVAKIVALGEASASISNMGDTIQKFAELRMPTKFDKNGKPIEFRPMTDKEFDTAAKNIGTIISFILNAISNDDITKTLEGLSKKAIKNIGLIMDNTAGVTNLIEAIEKSVKFDDETIGKGVGNLQSLISSYLITLQRLFVGDGELIEKSWFGKKSFKLEITEPPMIDASKLKTSIKTLKDLQKTLDPVNALMSSIDQMSKPTEDTASNISAVVKAYAIGILGDGSNENKGLQIDAKSYEKVNVLRKLVTEQERIAKIKPDDFQKNTENFVKLVDKANSIDTNKIRSIRDMFEQMARFSESVAGDFDKLADVLSEKLVDILEKLHGTLKTISESEPTNAITSTTETISETTTAETKNKQSDADKQEQERIKKLENQKAQDIKDINNAITEITELLKQVKNNTEKRKGFEF